MLTEITTVVDMARTLDTESANRRFRGWSPIWCTTRNSTSTRICSVRPSPTWTDSRTGVTWPRSYGKVPLTLAVSPWPARSSRTPRPPSPPPTPSATTALQVCFIPLAFFPPLWRVLTRLFRKLERSVCRECWRAPREYYSYCLVRLTLAILHISAGSQFGA